MDRIKKQRAHVFTGLFVPMLPPKSLKPTFLTLRSSPAEQCFLVVVFQNLTPETASRNNAKQKRITSLTLPLRAAPSYGLRDKSISNGQTAESPTRRPARERHSGRRASCRPTRRYWLISRGAGLECTYLSGGRVLSTITFTATRTSGRAGGLLLPSWVGTAEAIHGRPIISMSFCRP